MVADHETRADVPHAAAAPADSAPEYDGTTLGTAVHEVLQRFPLDIGPDDPSCGPEIERLSALWSAGGPAGLAAEVEVRVWAAVRSEIFELARTRPVWRELPVGMPTGGGTIEGFVDLCIDGPDGLIIVDYKTDRIADADLDGFASAYRLQLAAYALMLETVSARPVADARLLLLRPEAAIELAVVELEKAVSDVRLRLELRPRDSRYTAPGRDG